MRNSKILARLRAGKAARIVHLTHYIPMFVATAARANYDGVWIDLEHHAMEQREVQSLLAFCHRYDVDCMIRPPTKEKTRLYRLLEDGATGLLMPHVSSADEARQLVDAVKFPPIGDRGIEGFGLETNFSLDIQESVNELVEHAHRETFLFIQIETPGGLADVGKIAATPGVDGLYIGPVDLTTRLQHQPATQRPDMDGVMGRVADAARTHGIAWGSFATQFEHITMQYTRGARILIWGADLFLIKDGLFDSGRALAALLAEE